jgi:hypothetical protein
MSIFRKSVEKIQVSLKSGKNSGHFRWTQIYIYLWAYLAHFFLGWEMLQKNFVKKIKTHILCSMTFSWKSFRLWDNVENFCRAGQDTYDNIIGRMRISNWVPKATNTFSEYNMKFCFSTANNVCERAWMSRCTLSLLFSLLETVQTGATAHPVSYLMGAGSSFPGSKGTRTRSKTLHLYLVLMLKMCGAIPQFPHVLMEYIATSQFIPS